MSGDRDGDASHSEEPHHSLSIVTGDCRLPDTARPGVLGCDT